MIKLALNFILCVLTLNLLKPEDALCHIGSVNPVSCHALIFFYFWLTVLSVNANARFFPPLPPHPNCLLICALLSSCHVPVIPNREARDAVMAEPEKLPETSEEVRQLKDLGPLWSSWLYNVTV